MSHNFEQGIELPASAQAAYDWHGRPGAFERLVPPWESVRLLSREGSLESGRVVLEVALGPMRQRWVAQHRDGTPGQQFVDEQVEGPFAAWVHTHRFEPLGPARCRLVDQIRYDLPFGAAGALAAGAVARRLARTFRYRQETVAADLETQNRYAEHLPRNVAITGASGLIGRALVPFLTALGCRVVRVVRGRAGAEEIGWDPAAGRLDPASLEGFDAVVHLAGEPIAGGRWTSESRRRILESRTCGTTLLADTLARLSRPPRMLLSSSAVGIYGDRADERLTESAGLRTGPGTFFVEQVGHAWEAAVAPAERAGIRVVRARTGIVLSPAGGALAKMLPPFRAGVAGPLGSGQQYMSWIGIDDMLGAFLHLMATDRVSGPVNLTAPAPVTNAEFTATLARVLHRPAILPVPGAALRLLLGPMADELLLASTRVIPERLVESGYQFRHSALESALRHVLGR